MPKSRPLIERFLEKVEIKTSACWLWRANKSRQGYGRIWNGRRPEHAHRISYRLLVAPIPEGLFVLHNCNNPPCVNPAHLRLGTNRDNMRDREDSRAGRIFAAVDWSRK